MEHAAEFITFLEISSYSGAKDKHIANWQLLLGFVADLR
jgi:hypothetical protein